MMSVIAGSAKRKRDEIDYEFDAIMKADQVKRGVRHNGLFLVGKEPAPLVAAPVPAAPAKMSLRMRLAQLVFGDATA
jgi:hypothetical protein